jgi:hypothetical protein
MKLTVLPSTPNEQTALAPGSTLNVTGFPEAPPVAVTVYVAPPSCAFVGAVEVTAHEPASSDRSPAISTSRSAAA